MKVNLYDLSTSYLNVLELLEEDPNNTDFTNILESIEDEFETKAENIAKVINSLKGSVEILTLEESRLASRKRQIVNNIKRLQGYLESQMIATNKRKFKTDLFSFGIQKNPPSLKILEESHIPEEYYKIEKRLDKRGLLQDVKDGLEIDGVSIKQTEGLRIR